MIFDYIYDDRDQVYLGETPTVMMPIFGGLKELETGKKRYVIAKNGVYLEAKNRVLHFVQMIAEIEQGTHYGELNEFISLKNGKIPKDLIFNFIRKTIEHSPDEFAGLIVVNNSNEYEFITPSVVNNSASHITYSLENVDNDSIVLDMHSHGLGSAFFSPTDDTSDAAGIHLSAVYGNCKSLDSIDSMWRTCAYGSNKIIPFSVTKTLLD